VVGLGVFGTLWQGRVTENYIRQKLIHQAQGLANSLDKQLIQELNFTQSDSASLAYHRVKNQLKHYGQLVDHQGIYTLALKDNALKMGPNTFSQSFSSGELSQFLTEKRLDPEKRIRLHHGETVVLGPLGYSENQVMTALSPVYDPDTESLIMLVGIDILYDTYSDLLWLTQRRVLMMSILIGVILLSGAAINLVWRKRQESILRHLEIIITVVLGMLMTLTLTFMIYNYEHLERNEIYRQFCASISEDVTRSFETIRNNLNSLVRFQESSNYVDDTEFFQFVEPLTQISHAWFYSWVDYIDQAALESYEYQMGKEKERPFKVWEMTDEGYSIPVAPRNFYYPVRQIAPFSPHESLIGFDIASDPHLRETLGELLITNRMTATGILPDYRENSPSQVLYIMKPAFRHAHKEYDHHFSCDLMGIALTALHLPTILHRSITTSSLGVDSLICIHLVDLEDKEGQRIITSYRQDKQTPCPTFVEKGTLRGFKHSNSYPLFMFGRSLALVTHPTRAFYSVFPLRTTRLTSIAGLILTLLLALFIAYLRNRENRLASLVDQRTLELQEREEKYRLLTDNSVDMIWLMDMHYNFQYVSPAVMQMLGYAPEDIIGRNIRKFCAKGQFEALNAVFQKALKSLPHNEGQTFETELIRRNKTHLPVEIGTTLLLDDQGNPIGIQGSARDITERKKADEQLRNSDRIFKHALDMLCIAGFDGYFKVLNPSWTRVLGWSREELLSKPWIEFVHPEDRGLTENVRSILIDGQEIYQFENRYLCKDGSIKWLAWNSFPYPEEKILYGVARDITDKKKMEGQLKERLKELACISSVRKETLENLPEKEFCKRVIRHVKEAMQFPGSAFPVIELEGRIYRNGLTSSDLNKNLHALIKARGEVLGRLLVFYTEDKPFIIPEEQDLINSVADAIGLWYEWKRAQIREAHAKQVLLGIRNVNQLIVKETDRDSLVEKACKNLTETLGYQDAWITMIDDKKNIHITKTSGKNTCGFKKHFNQLTEEKLPACITDVVKSQSFHIYHGLESACSQCEFSDKNPNYAVYSAPLNYQKKLYGVLTVGVPPEFADLNEEQNLFIEVAEDIGFALYKIELEEKRKASEEQILKNLQEKEILLQEIHHRVKNNLNVISSLLKLQARKVNTKEDAIEAFKNSSNRVLAMALVHKKLYDTKNFEAVDLESYLISLARQLVSTYAHGSQIRIKSDVEDIALDINTAVPCGLILNELISNALKYAFQGRETGEIHLKVFTPDSETVQIQVKDDGVGLPKGFDPTKSNTLGFHLVELLTEQIKGSLQVESKQSRGTVFTITFPQKA
jgi:PAS domain S-box-containing protein